MKIKFILAFVILICFNQYSNAQSKSPIEVVQKQLDAYNAQDIEEFTSTFDKDAKIYMNIGDTIPRLQGQKEIKDLYGKMFLENPQNKSTLKGRMLQGNFVFDHEWIMGREKSFSIVAIYEVENDVIIRAWFVR